MPAKEQSRVLKEVEIKKKRNKRSKEEIAKTEMKSYGLEKKVVVKTVEQITYHFPFRLSEIYKVDDMNFRAYNEAEQNIEFEKVKREVPSSEIKTEDDVGYIIRDPLLRDDGFVKKRLMTLQVEFLNGNKTRKLPYYTTSACQWCCHKFENTPIGIPVKYVKSRFYLKGVFCSFNCAAASIFDQGSSDMWEHYSLLNLLYKQVTGVDEVRKIPLAPPRESLDLFGGPMTIEQFREDSWKNERKYDVVVPPIVSLVPKLEENYMAFEMTDESHAPINQHHMLFNGPQNSMLNKPSTWATAQPTTLNKFLESDGE